MQRRARTYATGVTGFALAALLSGALTGCSGSSDDSDAADTKPGSSSSAGPPAEPGKYRTLPEPCGAVGLSTLKKLLPGAEAAAGGSGTGKADESDPDASPYKGEATVTYDTDRRAGCRWKSSTTLATRHLSVDLERVVSYDPAVSDDEQAQLLYDERAGQAEIPTDDESTPPDDESDGGKSAEDADPGGDGDAESGHHGGDTGGEKDGGKDADGGKNGDKSKGADGGDGGDAEGEKSDSGSGSGDESGTGAEASQPADEDLSPRMLDDIGDNAYIDDQLDTGDSGVHRDITLVFRSANVIATVKYDQWLTDKRRTPDSAELQEKARSVAEELAADFDDN